MDFHAVTMEEDGTHRDTETKGIQQARLLLQHVCSSGIDLRDLEELHVLGKYPCCYLTRVLTTEAQHSQHMALASMAAAFQNLQVCIAPHIDAVCEPVSVFLTNNNRLQKPASGHLPT